MLLYMMAPKKSRKNPTKMEIPTDTSPEFTSGIQLLTSWKSKEERNSRETERKGKGYRGWRESRGTGEATEG